MIVIGAKNKNHFILLMECGFAVKNAKTSIMMTEKKERKGNILMFFLIEIFIDTRKAVIENADPNPSLDIPMSIHVHCCGVLAEQTFASDNAVLATDSG